MHMGCNAECHVLTQHTHTHNNGPWVSSRCSTLVIGTNLIPNGHLCTHKCNASRARFSQLRLTVRKLKSQVHEEAVCIRWLRGTFFYHLDPGTISVLERCEHWEWLVTMTTRGHACLHIITNRAFAISSSWLTESVTTTGACQSAIARVVSHTSHITSPNFASICIFRDTVSPSASWKRT